MTTEEQGFRSAVLDFEEKHGRTPTTKELTKIKESIKSDANVRKRNRRLGGSIRKNKKR